MGPPERAAHVIRPAQAGLIALILGAAALGFAPIFVRLSEVGPVATAFHRLALSLPIFAVLAWRHRGVPAGPGSALAGVFFAADLSVWHVGILLTSVANATLFTNLAPVFVTLGLWLIWGQRPNRRFVLALAMALTGAVMLMGGSLTVSPERLLGDGLSVLSGAFYGAYILTVGRSRPAVPAAVLMLRSGVVASILVLPVALALGETILPQTLQGWAVLLGLALVTQVGGQGLIAWGLAHLPSSFGAVVLLLQPLVAALVAWVLFGEALGPLELTGAGVVLLGMYCARKARRA
ncbi:MAG: DMT family transporter [Rhodospirillaceae bacterium]|nr:DMT family transporter [Rhodospirillales bacterium]